jgi:hypothetical protein
MNEVLASGKPFELTSSITGLEQIMYVRWDYEANLLEVGVAFPENDEEYVFHASKATKLFEEKFNL